MKFQQATLQDLPQLTKIMSEAIHFLQTQGSPQWQDGYGPTTEKLTVDIQNKATYVLRTDTNEIAGTIALITGVDPAYTNISEGDWLKTQSAYVSFHRVAINQKYRGQNIATQLMEHAILVARDKGFHDLRIDTHELNLAMQKVIAQTGFSYRGVVHFPIPNGKRLAYQRII